MDARELGAWLKQLPAMPSVYANGDPAVGIPSSEWWIVGTRWTARDNVIELQLSAVDDEMPKISLQTMLDLYPTATLLAIDVSDPDSDPYAIRRLVSWGYRNPYTGTSTTHARIELLD